MRKIEIINADSELGAGKRGGSVGFSGLLTAARKREHTFFNEYNVVNLPNRNIVLDRPPEYSYAKRIHFITEYYESLSNTVNGSFMDDAFPIIITGDHSSGGAVIAGVRKHFPEKRVGVVWIDAHADLHTPYTTPSGNLHGMPLAIAMGLDNRGNQRNDIGEALTTAWNRIKGAGGQTPSIQPTDLFYVGLRSVETEEWALINEHDIPNRTVEYVRGHGIEFMANEILTYFKNFDVIHVSFDVDSMDPKLVSDGTGTPVPGGFDKTEARALLKALLNNERVRSLEITEINPTLDTGGNSMSEAAFDILLSVADVIEERMAGSWQVIQ